MDADIIPSNDGTERGPGGRLTGETRKAIQMVFLTEGLSRVALAKRFAVDRETVARCLRGEDFVALETAALEQRKVAAKNVLSRNVETAAERWVDTFAKAVKHGNHKPMQDLMKAAGVIEDTDQPRIVVQVGVKLSGHPEA